ncbi:MAG: YjgP/YjgQ family permease, partial [Bacteroidetes bacterium]
MFGIRLKKADRLLLENFMPPFVVTFFIALFVLVMQTLWVYIDDIAGKGVGFFLMVELLSYMSVSMIPLALPIAVLISSVMVLGNMAERYELSSFKSAGVSLWRVLMPLIATTTAIAGFSFFCSNNLIPVSNLKFKSRLHDIRKQKPTLSLEEGVFNDDFEGYAIRIGKKMPDHRHIKDILLYDHSDAGEGRLLAVTADEGEMYATKDGDFFILHLKNGHQYAEPKPTKKGKDKRPNQPFSRTSFREWYKVFDLDEFEIDRTDESLFKSHHSMLNTRQLRVAIDSIDRAILDRLDKMAISNEKYFYPLDQARKEKMRAEARKAKAEKVKKISKDLQKKQD